MATSCVNSVSSFRIKTYNAIAEGGRDVFHDGEIGPDIDQPDALLLRSHKLTDSEITSSVRAIGRAGAGINNIPVETCTKRGVAVFNAPGQNAEAVAQMVVSTVLLSLRHAFESISWLSSATQGDEWPAIEKAKARFVGRELGSAVIGIVGLGHVGLKVAAHALHFGARVVGFDPVLSTQAQIDPRISRVHSLADLVSQSSVISLHLPLNDATQGLLNYSVFEICRPGTTLVNFARGELVVEPALLHALEVGHIATYISDFPTPALCQHPEFGRRIVTFPHLGASARESEDRCSVVAAQRLRAFLETGSTVGCCNLPELDLPPVTGWRVVSFGKGGSPPAPVSSPQSVSAVRGDLWAVSEDFASNPGHLKAAGVLATNTYAAQP